MKTIVLATDGSASADAALKAAIQLGYETGAALWCVAVDDSLATVGIDPAAEDSAQSAAQIARDHGLQAEAVVKVGPAVERILAVADDVGADLIVAGSHGRSPLTSAILGSVSVGLIRASRRPVVVVKAG